MSQSVSNYIAIVPEGGSEIYSHYRTWKTATNYQSRKASLMPIIRGVCKAITKVRITRTWPPSTLDNGLPEGQECWEPGRSINNHHISQLGQSKDISKHLQQLTTTDSCWPRDLPTTVACFPIMSPEHTRQCPCHDHHDQPGQFFLRDSFCHSFSSHALSSSKKCETDSFRCPNATGLATCDPGRRRSMRTSKDIGGWGRRRPVWRVSQKMGYQKRSLGYSGFSSWKPHV